MHPSQASKNKKSSGQLNLRSCRVSMILASPKKCKREKKQDAKTPQNVKTLPWRVL
jgi:hypothetical protein